MAKFMPKFMAWAEPGKAMRIGFLSMSIFDSSRKSDDLDNGNVVEESRVVVSVIRLHHQVALSSAARPW